MRLWWIGLVGALLLVLGGTPALGQSSADAFFHDAAQRYVAGDTEAARRAVERGLDIAPSDPRLRALRRKLEQQEDRRGGGRTSQQGQSSQNQRGPSGGNDAQRERSGAPKEESQSENGDASKGERSRSRDAEASPGDGGAQGPQGNPRSGDRQSTPRLSRAQAVRLLQALEKQEQKLLREVQKQSDETQRVDKDW